MADGIPFDRDLDFEYGRIEHVSPLIRRVIAPNGGPFTFHGTGTYVIGRGKLAVVDPGPLLASHIEALKHALRGETITQSCQPHHRTIRQRPRRSRGLGGADLRLRPARRWPDRSRRRRRGRRRRELRAGYRDR